MWETTYLHVLTGDDPVLALGAQHRAAAGAAPCSTRTTAAEFTAEYAAALRDGLPARPDGTTLLPFRRVFAVGTRPPEPSARGVRQVGRA